MAHHDPIGLIAPNAGLAQLNERSRDIFRQIVESYLATGEPVGSRNISRLIAVPLSPASVRNVMSDLEQLGLIYAPHTSAGRLPTELGLRFFVDALMQVGDLTEPERQSIQSQLVSVGKAQSVEAALGEALTRLSGLTRAAAVVLTAKSNSRLKHIEFVRLEPERALVVLVAEDGQVENRVLVLPPGVPSSALTEASNFLNARIRGRTLAEARLGGVFRPGGDGQEPLRGLRDRGGLARGGEALLDEADAGVIARLGIGVLAGAGEQLVVAVKVVGAQVCARLGAEAGAECATGLGGSEGLQADAGRGAGRVCRRRYASEA